MAAYDNLLLQYGGGIISSHSQSAVYENEANLCIGLGGTGIAALRRLKQKVYEQIRPDDPDSDIPSYGNIRFLAVDGDPTVERGRGKAKIREDEYFSINQDTLTAVMGSQGGRNQVKKDPLLNWMNIDKIVSLMSAEGAGGIRQIGRYLLMEKSSEYKTRITADCLEALRHATEGKLNVYIFAGISGGTGSGTFIDTCYIVRQVIQEQGWTGRAKVFGFFFLPDVVTSKPEVAKDIAIVNYNQSNGYAAMKELDYLMDLKNAHDVFHQKYNGFEITTDEAPVDLCFLVSAIPAGGKIRENAFNYSMNVAADFVASYMVKVDDSEKAADANAKKDDDGGITMRGLIANIARGVGSLSKDCGANRCYQIIGASDAEIPITQISTYLACGFYRKFESYVDRKAATEKATKQDIDKLAKALSLDANGIRNKVNAGRKQLMLPDVDFKSLKDCGTMPAGKAPELWGKPGNNWLNDNSGIRKKNEVALARDLEGADIFNERQYVDSDTKSLIVSTYLQLLDYCRNPEYGPYYAAAMLQNSGYDLRSAIDGSIEALKQSKGTINLQLQGRNGNDGLDQDIVQKSVDFCKSSFLNEKKSYVSYKDDIRRWYEYADELNQLDTAIKVLQKVKIQLDDLYTKYFAPLIEMLDRLHDTFRDNAYFLANKTLTQPEGTFTTQILHLEDIKQTLDDSINKLTAKVTVQDFMTIMLANHSEWLKRDEGKIGVLISKFLNAIFKEQLDKSITSYLKIKFPQASDAASLAQAIQDEIIKDIYVRSVPMFWSDPNFKLTSSTFLTGVITVPEVATDVCKAAEDFFKVASISNSVRKTDIKDRIFEMRLYCGVPLYAYKGVKLMYQQYEVSEKLSSGAGIHLYEYTGRGEDETGFRNWRTYLPNPAPYSKAEELTPGVEDKLDLYEKAEHYGFISVSSDDAMYYVHLCAKAQPRTFVLKDFLIQDAQDRTQFNDAKYQQIQSQIKSELDHPQYVADYTLRSDGDIGKGQGIVDATRRDYFLHYPVLQKVIQKNLDRRVILEKELAELEELKATYDSYQKEIHNFACLLLDGKIRSEDAQGRESFQHIKKITYTYLARGVEEKTVIMTDTTKDFQYGRELPMYEAFCTYRSMDNDHMPKSGMITEVNEFEARTLEGKDARLGRKLELVYSAQRIGEIGKYANARSDGDEIMRFYYGLVDEIASYRNKFDYDQWTQNWDSVSTSNQPVTLYGNGKYLYVYPDQSMTMAWDGAQWLALDATMMRWDGTKWLPVQLDAKGQILL